MTELDGRQRRFLRGVAHHDEAHAIRIRERIHADLVNAAVGPATSPSEQRR